MANLETLMGSLKTGSFGLAGFFTGYAEYLGKCLKGIDLEQLTAVGEIFLRARTDQKTLFFAGNGGSAATASHFCQDVAEVGRKAGKEGFRVLSLTDNTAYVTAAGNDYGFDAIFTNQMAFLFQENDVLVVISASGNSPNVVKAAQLARERKGIVIALVGFDGGLLKDMADHVLRIPTIKGEYGPVEDGHLIVAHVITAFLTARLQTSKT
ncbi:MAG: SIS domain-containing protein [Magnetococcales bacterium]|nr:SIS domain-containing protein [Magnetococcales bacterium]